MVSEIVTLTDTFALVMVASLVVILVGVWAWALFMFKANREMLAAHRELVSAMVGLKGQELFRPYTITHAPFAQQTQPLPGDSYQTQAPRGDVDRALEELG